MSGKEHEPLANEEPRRGVEFDARGVLAILSIVGVFAMAFVQLLVLNIPPDIPPWAAAIAASITGFYFGSRGGADHIR